VSEDAIGNAIEGGRVAKDDDGSIQVGDPRPVEKHRRLVTITLIALLAVIIIGHYIVLVVLEWNGKRVDSVNSAFNAALPVVSGLVGSAVTYYFTRGR